MAEHGHYGDKPPESSVVTGTYDYIHGYVPSEYTERLTRICHGLAGIMLDVPLRHGTVHLYPTNELYLSCTRDVFTTKDKTQTEQTSIRAVPRSEGPRGKAVFTAYIEGRPGENPQTMQIRHSPDAPILCLTADICGDLASPIRRANLEDMIKQCKVAIRSVRSIANPLAERIDRINYDLANAQDGALTILGSARKHDNEYCDYPSDSFNYEPCTVVLRGGPMPDCAITNTQNEYEQSECGQSVFFRQSSRNTLEVIVEVQRQGQKAHKTTMRLPLGQRASGVRAIPEGILRQDTVRRFAYLVTLGECALYARNTLDTTHE